MFQACVRHVRHSVTIGVFSLVRPCDGSAIGFRHMPRLEDQVGDPCVDLLFGARRCGRRSCARSPYTRPPKRRSCIHSVRRDVDGGSDIVAARRREEDEAKKALARLEKIGPNDPSFETEFTAFRHDVLRHADREEHDELPQPASVRRCTEAQKPGLGLLVRQGDGADARAQDGA
jgi:hypothetical protein